MRSRVFLAILFLFLGAVLALSGCGGDEEGETENLVSETSPQNGQQGATGVVRQFRISPDPIAHLENSHSIIAIGFTPDSLRLFAISLDNISEYDLNTQQQIGTWNIDSVGSENGGALRPDGKVIAIGSEATDPEEVLIWDTTTHSVTRRLKMPANLPIADGIPDVAFSPDGNILAAVVGSSSEHIFLWSTKNYEQIAQIKAEAGDRLAFRPDGKVLAVSNTSENFVTFFDMKTHKVISKIEPPGRRYIIKALAFSPNGRSLVGGGYIQPDFEPVFQLWNADTGNLVITPDFPEQVDALAYDSDGVLLAVGSATQLGVWKTDTQEFIVMMEIPGRLDRGLGFSPDGSLLVAGLEDGEGILLWKVE